MKKMKHEYVPVELKHYTGTLDYPCDFCDSNSYDNYHVTKWGQLIMVFCVECFEKIKVK